MFLQQYQEAIENSNIVSKTDMNGIITFVNDEFCKISGYTKKELIGSNHNIVRHPDVLADTFELLWDTIKAKQTYKATVKNMAKDGSTFYLNTTVTPILDENGDIEEFIAIRYDVTKEMELKQALERQEVELERRVQEKTHQLKELNKTLELRVLEEIKKNEEKQKILFMQSRLANQGQMIANIAHQWRQPLTELNLSLFNMKKALTNCDQQKMETFYKDSKTTIKNMSNTIENFTNFFNPNKKKESFYLDNALNDGLEILKKEMQKEKITVKRDFEKIKVVGVTNELTQVILNLIQNSKDAFISKKIKNREVEFRITKIYRDFKKFAAIYIEDNAGGVRDDYLDKIFEPYFTTKHSSVGTGLGLFMSKMIIEKSLNGMINVSNRNNGLKFIITIPLEK